MNGWTAKDLLTIIAKENIDILKAQGALVDAQGVLTTTPFDERIPGLLLIGVLAVIWLGVSVPTAARLALPETAVPVAPAVGAAPPTTTYQPPAG